MNSPDSSDIAPADDGFGSYYAEKLWAWIPEVYRTEDLEGPAPGALRALIEVIAWRTDRVPSAQAPKTLDGLMDPKWKGRAGTVRVREPFIDAMTKIYGEKAAMEKIDLLIWDDTAAAAAKSLDDNELLTFDASADETLFLEVFGVAGADGPDGFRGLGSRRRRAPAARRVVSAFARPLRWGRSASTARYASSARRFGWRSTERTSVPSRLRSTAPRVSSWIMLRKPGGERVT